MWKTFQIMGLSLTMALVVACSGDGSTEVSRVEADGPLVLVPGRTVTIAGGIDDKPSVVAEGAAGLNPAPDPSVPDTKSEAWTQVRARPAKAPKNTVVFSVWADSKNGTLIRADNGYDKPLIYVIYLGKLQNGEMLTAATGTCAVAAGSSSFEARPSPVDAVYVVSMGIVDDADLCHDEKTGGLYRPPTSKAASPTTRH